MARRMFSPQIVGSDAFLDMPISTQALYFHLGMSADDDGFVAPKKIMRMVGASEDDLKVLATKKFVIQFENGVIVIKHWRMNNLIRKDRYHSSQYFREKKQLYIRENQAYTLNPNDAVPFNTAEWQPDGNQRLTEVRLGKVSINTPELCSGDDKKNMKKNSFNYREDQNSDAYEDVIDADSGEARKSVKTNATEKYWDMLRWAESRRGFKFLSIPKQFKAFKIARENKILPSELKNRWSELEEDKFWKEKGFDWVDVVNNFNKKR